MPVASYSTLEEFNTKKYIKTLEKENEKNFIAILPNLRFRNGNVYFLSNKPIKLTDIKTKNKNSHYEFILENISLKGSVFIKDIKFNCEILEEEIKNGLKIKVSYIDQYLVIDKVYMQKVSRAVEAKILGINIFDDDDNIDYDDNLNKYDKNNDLHYETISDYEDDTETNYEEYYSDYDENY
jgi:hypothetical protein